MPRDVAIALFLALLVCISFLVVQQHNTRATSTFNERFIGSVK